jgi:uncharacterized secreted repeat protein (TIGR03808 family)
MKDPVSLSRRSLLAGLAYTSLGCAFAFPADASSTGLSSADLRGAIDAGEQGISPDGTDQSRALSEAIARAALEKRPLFLPPGDYPISNLDLPDGARITGVAGASRIIYSGRGFLLRALEVSRIEFSGLVIDGMGRPLRGEVEALIHLNGVSELAIDNCEIAGSGKSGIRLERCGGRIERSRIITAAEYGLYAVESRGLSVIGNTVADCGNGGILVHRWTKGIDGTIVSGNRLMRIGASYGGTGQYGNAINIYRADNVMVSGNHISDAAFSAIRANAASNVQIAGNQCFGSRETAIYSEFGFEGAMVSGNLVDGAANGISVVNFNEGGRLAVISGNLIRNISASGPYIHDSVGFGIGISAEADTAVTGNVIENVPKWGMLIGWGPYLRNLAATGNVVRQARVGCAVSVVEEAGKALISGNLFDAMTDGAVIGYRWHDAATQELAKGTSDFRHLTIEGNRFN